MSKVLLQMLLQYLKRDFFFFFSEPTDIKHTNRPFVENKKKKLKFRFKSGHVALCVRLMFVSQMGKVPSPLNLDTRVYLSG